MTEVGNTQLVLIGPEDARHPHHYVLLLGQLAQRKPGFVELALLLPLWDFVLRQNPNNPQFILPSIFKTIWLFLAD